MLLALGENWESKVCKSFIYKHFHLTPWPAGFPSGPRLGPSVALFQNGTVLLTGKAKPIPKPDLASFYEKPSAWVLDPGTYTFRVGDSSRNILCESQLKLKKQTKPVSKSL